MNLNLKGLKSTVIKSFFLLIIVFSVMLGQKLYTEYYSTMPKSHVFVCDNPSYKSEFDLWLSDSLKLTWVPSYVIIKDGNIIGAFNGCIEEYAFSNMFGTTLALSIPFGQVPDYQITNLNNERISLPELFKEGTYILEIHWLTCKDCIYQDEHYTKDIYAKYTTKHIYRYYLKSEFKDVLAKYN